MRVANSSEQRWILVLALGLLVSSFALTYVTRSGNCFDSSWISSIEVSDTPSTIYSCKSRRPSTFDQWIFEHLRNVSTRVKAVERVLANLDIRPRALGAIKISTVDLTQPGSLERQILSRALWGNIKDLEYNLLTDLLLESSVEGEQLSAEGSSLDQQMWHTLLHAVYDDLGLHERNRMIREWIAKLKIQRRALTEKNSTWEFAQKIQKKAQIIGFDPADGRWNLQSLIVFEKDPGPQTESRLRTNRIASLRQQKLQLPFSSDRFSLAETGSIRVGKLVLIRCRFPDFAELEFIGFDFEHVVVIQTCEDHIPDFYISALRNTKDFAAKYPESQFVHLHWPSLRMVLARSGVKARTIASLFEPGSIQTFEKVGFLRSLTKDSESGLGHWDGTLEPVLYYRF